MNEVEKGVLRRGYTLAVFLDVAGAFNNLSFQAAEKALKNKKITQAGVKSIEKEDMVRSSLIQKI